MFISVVVSYYKNILNLDLIIRALALQSDKSFEVIVSEDDNSEETYRYIEGAKSKYDLRISHVNQHEDNGFRKNQMLNKSLVKASGELVVFIDGDCIPHKHLVKEYRRNFEKGYILYGRRVNLGKQFSNKLKRTSNLASLNFLSVFFSDSKKRKEAIYFPLISLMIKERGLLGCNWGIAKEHLLQLNGFDEDYVRASVGEDTDIEWRLRNSGIKMKSVKNKAIVYHVYHSKGYSNEDNKHNCEILEQKQQQGFLKCKNGIAKL